MFLPDFSKKAHRDAPPTYLVRGIRPLATRGDQRSCVTTCFCRIFRKTPTEMPTPHTSLGASGPLPPVGIKGAALLHVFPASAGLGSAQPLGRKRPTFGPIFQTAPTDTRPPPQNKSGAYSPWPPVGIKGAALLRVFPASARPGSARPLGRKQPAFGPIFQTTPTETRPRPLDELGAYGPRPPAGIKRAESLHVFPASG
jgi:hypothetical protein